MEEELRGVNTTITDNDEKVITLRQQIEALENEIDIRSNVEAEEEETEEEKTERLALVNTLSQELFKKSGEVDVCIEVNSKVKESIEPLKSKLRKKIWKGSSLRCVALVWPLSQRPCSREVERACLSPPHCW